MSPVVVPVWSPVEIVEVKVVPAGEPGQFILTLNLKGGMTDAWKRMFGDIASSGDLTSTEFRGEVWSAQGDEAAITYITRRSLAVWVGNANDRFREEELPNLEAERDQRKRHTEFAAEATRRLNPT
jgi:hypothetical protein